MAKRPASNQLNHENWDKEEDPEDPGVFKQVYGAKLSERIIKIAKRRLTKEPTTNPFASFGGFGTKNNTSVNNTISPNFTNLSSSQNLSNGNLNAKSSNSMTEKETDKLQGNQEVQPKDSLRDVEYYRLLKGLNESLAQWIQQHVAKNALCDFTPVFRDYEKHLQDLEAKFPICDKSPPSSSSTVNYSKDLASEHISDSPSVPINTTKSTASSIFTLPNTTFSFCTNSVNNSNPMKYTFSNLSSTTTSSTSTSTVTTPITKITFGSSNSSVTSTPTFQFGLQTPPISFGNVSSPSTGGTIGSTTSVFTTPVTSKSNNSTETFSFGSAIAKSQEKKETKDNDDCAADEENIEPPKNEFVPVVEEEALYSKRCKLFYNKDGNYVEKGVGVLYLKSMDNKTQLLVRADTNLGNILLNIILTDTLPIKRVGKNNVLIICVPNPPINPKQESTEAIPLLIRVKTTEDADELLQKLEEHKKS